MTKDFCDICGDELSPRGNMALYGWQQSAALHNKQMAVTINCGVGGNVKQDGDAGDICHKCLFDFLTMVISEDTQANAAAPIQVVE